MKRYPLLHQFFMKVNLWSLIFLSNVDLYTTAIKSNKNALKIKWMFIFHYLWTEWYSKNNDKPWPKQISWPWYAQYVHAATGRWIHLQNMKPSFQFLFRNWSISVWVSETLTLFLFLKRLISNYLKTIVEFCYFL